MLPTAILAEGDVTEECWVQPFSTPVGSTLCSERTAFGRRGRCDPVAQRTTDPHHVSHDPRNPQLPAVGAVIGREEQVAADVRQVKGRRAAAAGVDVLDQYDARAVDGK